MKPEASVKVFIAGSRAISRLNAAIRERLDRIVHAGHEVLIGDANGADRVVQQYLADLQYKNVLIFCTGSRCRNNVGGWSTMAVSPPADVHGGFDFYAVKDREMAALATHGLMLWDGESRGTLTNVRNLIEHGKPVVVYFSPTKSFATVRNQSELDDLRRVAPAPGR